MAEPQLMDAWLLLQGLFLAHRDDDPPPEFEFTNLTPDEVTACAVYLMDNCREISARFVISGTQHRVLVPSTDAVAFNLRSGTISAAMWLGFSTMPGFGLYIENTDRLSIAIDPTLMNAMTVMQLFDLFFRLLTIAPSGVIAASALSFQPSERELFGKVWHNYVTGTS